MDIFLTVIKTNINATFLFLLVDPPPNLTLWTFNKTTTTAGHWIVFLLVY